MLGRLQLVAVLPAILFPTALGSCSWRSAGFAHSAQNRCLEAGDGKQDIRTAFLFHSTFALMAVTPSDDWRSKGSGDVSIGGHTFGIGVSPGALVGNGYPFFTHDPASGSLTESLTLLPQANHRGLSSLRGSWPVFFICLFQF